MKQPLIKQISLRLFLALLLSALFSGLVGLWFYSAANTRAQQQQLSNAHSHYVNVIASLERKWGRDAYNLKARLEFSRLLENPANRDERLNNYLMAQGGSPEFPELHILDHAGNTVAHYAYGKETHPETVFPGTANETWAYDSEAKVLYRVYRQPIWLGNENGTLLLYKPADHAFLSTFSYPQTDIALLWMGEPVASSLGGEGLTLAREHGITPDDHSLIQWDRDLQHTPRLLIGVKATRAFTPQELALPLLLATLMFALAAWAILGRWAWVMLGRVDALEKAQEAFAGAAEWTPDVEKRLDQARAGKDDEISSLTNTLGQFMHAITGHEELERASRAALQESELRFRTMVEAINDWFWIVNEHGVYTYASPKVFDLLGYRPEEVLGRTPFDFMPPEEVGRVAEIFTPLAAARQPIAMLENVNLHKDGRRIVMETSGTPIFDGDGNYRGYRGIDRDVTERRHVEERLALAGLVFDNADEGILVTDEGNHIIAVNAAFEHITGYRAADVMGHNPRLLKSGRQDATFYQSMWESLEKHGQWRGDIWNRRKSGEFYIQRTSIVTIASRDGKAKRHVAIFHDVTLEKRQADEIQYQASHDPLTGLPNRRLLRDRIDGALARALRENKRVGVIMLDLDGFKHVNDTLGHRVGDLLLIQAAWRLKECVRGADTLARLGGDEFMVVIENVAHQHDVQTVTNKILEQLQENFLIEESEIYVTGSLGIAMYPEDGDDTETLMANADTAMYQAKSGGKNGYRFFTHAMHELVSARVRMENDLRRAVLAGDFVLHYQPVLELPQRRLVKAEALVRWDHPERGLVSPLEFIPVAEETGLIIPLGEWVMHEAARQVKAWQELAPPGFRVCVNVSAHQFHRDNPVELVQRALSAAGARTEQLLVEITESLFLEDPNGLASSQLRELMGHGIQIAIDDFGTGYSSLSYLKNFPVNTLKIDRTFVNGIPDEPQSMALIDAVLSLSSSFGLDVVAEGVETEEQADHLAGKGCRYAQGYLFGRPMPAHEFEKRFFGALVKTQ